MITNYKFQDLAKFVEDLKFLLARGGTSGFLSSFSGQNSTITQIVLSWIYTAIVWILIILAVYVIYQILFKGYPRFPIDLAKFKLYNRVDTKKNLGGPKGLLYSNIFTLSEPSMNEPLSIILGNQQSNVFRELVNTIDDMYEPVYGTNRIEAALTDYYTFYPSITTGLGLQYLQGENRSQKMRDTIVTVFEDYLTFYTQLFSLNKQLACLFNEGRNDKRRANFKTLKTNIETQLQNTYKQWNIVPVETKKIFASSFIEPSHTSQCGIPFHKILEKAIEESAYPALQKQLKTIDKQDRRLRKLARKRKRTAKEKAEINARRQALQKDKLQVKIDMALAMKMAEDKAFEELKKSGDVTFVFVSSRFQNPQTPARPVIYYDDTDRINPNYLESKGKDQFTVYVPCYDMYKQYFILNKDKMFSKYTQTMNEDEIIASIFLMDLDGSLENKETNSKTRDLVYERILKTQSVCEDVAIRAKTALQPRPNHPGTLVEYMIFPDQSVLETAVNELMLSKSKENIQLTQDYTYYLDEIFNADANSYQDLVRQFNAHKPKAVSLETLITYLNLPKSKRDQQTIKSKYGVSNSSVINFITTHPLFSMIYLKYGKDGEEMYKNVLNFRKSLGGVENKNMLQLVNMWEDKVFLIKKCMIALHIVNLYLNGYRDSVQERDPVTKIKLTKDGFVDIIQQQNISYNIPDFFGRLFRPFKLEFVDGRIAASWRRTFYGPRFNPSSSVSYWREFRVFWIDYMGKKMDGMMKNWWKSFKNVSNFK